MHRFGLNSSLWTLLAYCWVCAMYRLVSRTAVQHPSGVTLNYWVASGITTAFFVVLVLIALGKLGMIRGRWLVTAGALTYPLYLLHQQIGETIIRTFDNRVPAWLLLVGVFGVMLTLSWLVHRYAERPLAARARRVLMAGRDRWHRLRDRFSRQPDPSAVPLPSPAPGALLDGTPPLAATFATPSHPPVPVPVQRAPEIDAVLVTSRSATDNGRDDR
jgi:peptidoglycan/LPS O-acetylase OafA/YrhL